MTRDKPGKRLNEKYELVEQVGVGGMAVVWRGKVLGAHGFSCPVAVKRIREELRGRSHIVELLVEEARVDSVLRHPNIVQAHDFGVDESGDYYLVTEWVEGIHLEQYVRAFSLANETTPFDLVAAVGVEVLRGLDAAHRHRDAEGRSSPVLHRDVTPANILLDEHGFVKLTDFGLARAADRGRITHPDIIKGKISYLAPEMIQGSGPSPRTDLYGLGVVLWEALAGERLFDAPTDAEVFSMLQNPQVPLLTMKRPDIPLSLARIVHRALETDPSRRFAAAFEMMRALADDLRSLPRPVRSASLAESVVEARRRLRAASPGKLIDAHER